MSETMRNYLSLIKPRQTALLTYLGICSMLAANPHAPTPIILAVTLSLILSVAGATALTNYVDRDIDAIMERTKGRPLPSRGIDPPAKALWFGIALIILSLIFAFNINLWFVAFLIWGVINSVIVYNYLTKRKTPLNIFLASPTGAMPILGGWSAVESPSIIPVLMSLLIIIWIPIHVWSIVLKWKNDYLKAKIPMLPLDVGGSKLVACFSLIMALSSHIILSSITHSWCLIYSVMLPLNAILIALSLWLMAKPTARKAWILFKFTSPYITAIFTLWTLSTYLT